MKDYLLDLLNNHRKYQAKINLLRNNQCMFHDQDEFERFMVIEKDLKTLRECIEHLPKESKEILENIYFKGFSLSDYGRAVNVCKTAAYNRKQLATVRLRELFEFMIRK